MVSSSPDVDLFPFPFPDGAVLRLDYKMFEKEYLSNPKIDDLPLEYFKQFSPAIRGTTQEMEGSIKRETKQKMMPFYQNPPEISVDEAKNRIEKPYTRGN